MTLWLNGFYIHIYVYIYMVGDSRVEFLSFFLSFCFGFSMVELFSIVDEIIVGGLFFDA